MSDESLTHWVVREGRASLTRRLITSDEHSRQYLFPESMKFKDPTLEQMRELERAWVEAPPNRRLETVAAKAAELGVEIESMHRHRPGTET